MARQLARIHGTEEDKINCPFYFKIGACRHSDRCSRIHHRPAFSPTILIKHVYRHPIREAELQAARDGRSVDDVGSMIDEDKARNDFLIFFEDFFEELSKFGHLEALHVCDNLGDHMIGHVYAKFELEEEAADALNILNGRYYDGRKLNVEFSPVTDFREARCRDFDEDTCRRGGFCNFMHIKPVPGCLIRDMEDEAEDERRREEMERMDRRSHRGGSSSSRGNRRDHDRGGGGGDRGRSSRKERKGGSRKGGGGGGSSRSRSRSRSRSGSRERTSGSLLV